MLVYIRRTYNNFPLRSYVSALVDTLEDTDGAVRECARASVVELFTGPNVSDAARADLKKEMLKKGVRKTILESVQAKLALSASTSGPSGIGSDAGSENGDAPSKKQYIPPSMMLKRSMSTTSSGAVAGVGGVVRTFSQSTVNTLAESSCGRPDSRLAGESPPTPSEGTEVQAVYVRVSSLLSRFMVG